MGGHTELGECSSIGQVLAMLVDTDKECAGEYKLHFERMEVEWNEETRRFDVLIRYQK